MRRVLLLVTAIVLTIASPFALADVITAEQAAQHVGEVQTVRGVVVSATFAFRTKGKPTFLNLDRPYPGAIFTIVVWGSDRDKFTVPPEKAFKGQTVRVTGKITAYRGAPEIVVHDPAEIVVEIQTDPNPR